MKKIFTICGLFTISGLQRKHFVCSKQLLNGIYALKNIANCFNLRKIKIAIFIVSHILFSDNGTWIFIVTVKYSGIWVPRGDETPTVRVRCIVYRQVCNKRREERRASSKSVPEMQKNVLFFFKMFLVRICQLWQPPQLAEILSVPIHTRVINGCLMCSVHPEEGMVSLLFCGFPEFWHRERWSFSVLH